MEARQVKRSTPLKRTAFRKEGPSVDREVKPRAKETQAKQCPMCQRMFIPLRPMQAVCGPVCAGKKVRADKKAEAQNIKARKEAIKSRTEWEQECKSIVQKIARLRDRHDGCISCHMGANYGGQWHGSHFRPAGNHTAVELHLWNIHKSCAQCNKYKGGNIAGYRPRLIEKIGLDRVEWLEAQNQVVKRPIEYLQRFKRVMGKRLRRMEKRISKHE
jgi:hypothetical protein